MPWSFVDRFIDTGTQRHPSGRAHLALYYSAGQAGDALLWNPNLPSITGSASVKNNIASRMARETSECDDSKHTLEGPRWTRCLLDEGTLSAKSQVPFYSKDAAWGPVASLNIDQWQRQSTGWFRNWNWLYKVALFIWRTDSVRSGQLGSCTEKASFHRFHDIKGDTYVHSRISGPV